MLFNRRRGVFSFRIPVNGRHAKESPNPIFSSPYQVVISPPRPFDQVNYSTAQSNYVFPALDAVRR